MNSEPRPPSAPAPSAAVGHTGDHEDLAALYALDALDGDELVHFARHPGSCPRCQDVLAGDRLAVAAAADRPADGLIDAVPRWPGVRAARPRRDWDRWLLPVAALLLALIAGTAVPWSWGWTRSALARNLRRSGVLPAQVRLGRVP